MNRSKNSISRRRFLQQGAAVGTALAFPAIVPASVFGANAPANRITIASIGLGGMGTHDMRGFLANPGAEVVALCDVDARHLEAARVIAKLPPRACTPDFRELLARSDIDAAVVATPDHWHVPIALAAVKAGKDVYCEKPLTLTIAQGRVLADAVQRYGRVLQTGSQQRSGSEFRRACELVRNGRIGTLQTMQVRIPGNNKTCPPVWQPMPVPAGFDYDRWLGPAPWAPYTEQRCHYQFRFILDYSGGQITNWGAHHLDIAQWGNGTDHSGPVAVEGRGVFPREGLFTTALHVDVTYTYANGVRLFLKTGGTGTRFEGTDGWIFVDRGKLAASPESLLHAQIGPNELHLYESHDHKQNFLDCVRLRKQPVASAEIGHRSATLCHLGNIAMLLGTRLEWDPAEERFRNCDAANRMRSRSMRSPWRV